LVVGVGIADLVGGAAELAVVAAGVVASLFDILEALEGGCLVFELEGGCGDGLHEDGCEEDEEARGHFVESHCCWGTRGSEEGYVSARRSSAETSDEMYSSQAVKVFEDVDAWYQLVNVINHHSSPQPLHQMRSLRSNVRISGKYGWEGKNERREILAASRVFFVLSKIGLPNHPASDRPPGLLTKVTNDDTRMN
jgi:hypothetical protein